ncbi:MAG: hypothetical protein WC314_08175 [Vulcanimicrobiota bacterium]
MRRSYRFKILTLCALLGLFVLSSDRSSGQLILASGDYRVVEVDQEHLRVGVALLEAQPDERQNWIYLTAKTTINKRHSSGDGWFRDEKLSYEGFLNTVRSGDKLRVEGGRRWDGGITAKKIWM